MRVLLAEDDPVLAAVVVEALVEEGHQVTHLTDPRAVFSLRDVAAWDVLVVDSSGSSYLDLDPTDGATLRDLGARVPVILATGRPWAEATEASDLGLLAILRKPYDLDALLDAVQRAPAERARGAAAVALMN